MVAVPKGGKRSATTAFGWLQSPPAGTSTAELSARVQPTNNVNQARQCTGNHGTYAESTPQTLAQTKLRQ